MLTVGRDTSSSSASGQLTSRTQCSTPSSRFAAFSSRRRAASATIAFSSGESGRRSAAHTSELQSPLNISYAVFCLKKKKQREGKECRITCDRKNTQMNYSKQL